MSEWRDEVRASLCAQGAGALEFAMEEAGWTVHTVHKADAPPVVTATREAAGRIQRLVLTVEDAS